MRSFIQRGADNFKPLGGRGAASTQLLADHHA
jgi:hypothetical protein